MPITVFGAGIYFFIKLGFYKKGSLKIFTHGIRGALCGEVSPFKAMSLALAGTLGVGNIAGVAAAISTGGAGAIFWMYASAIAASALKYAETVLAVKHRRKIIEGGQERSTGGAFVYMKAHGQKRLALVFAALCVITSFSMGAVIQSNAVAVSLESGFGVSANISGALLALLTFVLISGGFKRIADLTVYAVPLFCALYSGVSLFIIFANITRMPGVLSRVVSEAFSLKAAGGGVLGFGILRAIRFGVARGILSNEAGSGTSVTAHAAADAKYPSEQGIFGILEVLVDTVLMCSMTAFVILLAPQTAPGEAAMVIAIRAYTYFCGSLAPGFMSTAVVAFAVGTVLCWSVYGVEALRFITCDYLKRLDFDKAKRTYYAVYSLCVFAGAILSGEFMWELSDFTTAVMTLVNVSYLVYCINEVKSETKAYTAVITGKRRKYN